jgi:hypothetical protein
MWRAKLAMLVGLVLLAGCSEGQRFNPVVGKVFWRGKPAVGARVIFHPASATPNQPQPSAVVGEDGSFRLRTYVQETRATGDGAPAGEYKVTIDWSDLSPEAVSVDPGAMPPKPSDKLGGRYADSKRSTLQVTIKEGENTLQPFELK